MKKMKLMLAGILALAVAVSPVGSAWAMHLNIYCDRNTVMIPVLLQHRGSLLPAPEDTRADGGIS